MNLPSPNDAQDSARLMRFVLIALAIFLGYHMFFEKPLPATAQQQQQAQIQKPVSVPAPAAAPEVVKPRDEVIASTPRVPIRGDKVTGSVSLAGGRIDDLSLIGYFTTAQGDKVTGPDPDHDLNKGLKHSGKELSNDKGYVTLLSPSGTKDAYYVEGGWTSDDKSVVLPTETTVWSLAPGSAAKLTSGGSVTLRWDNGHDLIFERTIALDENYLFTVTQTVTNKTKADVKLNAWHLISRHNLPEDFKGFFILHEGPLADLDNKLKEMQYKKLAEGETLEQDNTHGWLGITDKYWFVGLFPPPQEEFNARIIGSKTDTAQSYQTDVVSDTQTLAPGKTITDKNFVFAGVKNLPLMNTYESKYGFAHMDLTFDFGIFYLITKPFFYLLHFLMKITGNVGAAILCMTVIIRSAMFPLANRSFRSMAGMKKIAPQMKELQAKYGNDREKLQVAIFELYKQEDVTPFGGCWPMLVQIPIFFALYKSILLSVELRHAPFWGWIHDLSAPDPTNVFNLFGLLPWTVPSTFAIGAWPCLFCLTMIVQRRLSAPMPDKTQETMQNYMPFIVTFMLAKFNAGLVIYWTWSNTLGVLQQYYILNKIGEHEVSLLRGHSERYKKKPAVDG